MHRPRKGLGQHFLHSRDIIERIIAAIDPEPGQHLVEIGPGRGAITVPLLYAGVELDAIELDQDLIPSLEQLGATAHGRLHLHHADALEFDLCAHGQKLRVVGNLPYNISTPLIFRFLDQRQCICDMHFMLQKEVVDRMASPPGSKEYGRLSVMVQYYCEVVRLFAIGPGAFTPAPKVESALVRLIPRPAVAGEPDAFANVVKQAFAQRRKTLRNALRGLLDIADFEAAGIDPGLRAEQLGLDEFARLSDRVTIKRSDIARQSDG